MKLDGAVEHYLVALEARFRLMLRELLEAVRATAGAWEADKPREFWREDYSAQMALVGT